MTLGQWFGHWLGDWFGPLEAAPEGSIAGSATITVAPTGTASAIGHMAGSASVTVGGSGALTGIAEASGTATVTINGTGTLTDTGGAVSDTRLDQILAILMGRKVYDSTTRLWRVYDSNGVELADPSGILLRGLHGWLLQANQRYFSQEEAQSGVRRLMYYQLQEQALLKRDAERQDAIAAPQTPQAAKKRTAKSRRIVKATPREVVVPMDPAWYNAPAPLPKFSTVDWAPLIKASNALAEVTRHVKLTEASNDTRRRRRDEEILLLMAA